MEIWLCYLIHFAICLAVGSGFCIGLFHSSQGDSSVKPDGKETTDWAMIFYPITKFLSQKKTIIIYYEGTELEDLYYSIKCDFKQYGDLVKDVKVTNEEIKIEKAEDIEIWQGLMCDIEKKYKVWGHIADSEMVFYKEYEKNVYSEYWTKPLLLCYKCYASIWGTIIFTLMTCFSIRTGLIQKDFYILIPMWILYCFSLVTANMWLNKKVD